MFNSRELKPREPQEFEPVRMALSGHQFFRAFADSFGTLAAKEGEETEINARLAMYWRF